MFVCVLRSGAGAEAGGVRPVRVGAQPAATAAGAGDPSVPAVQVSKVKEIAQGEEQFDWLHYRFVVVRAKTVAETVAPTQRLR